jgi:oligopeptide transport system substrate-binding protein
MAADLPQVSDGGTTLTFTLKPDVVFSDGTPLTAAHFEYGWKRQLNPDVGSRYAFLGDIIEGGQAYRSAVASGATAEQRQALRDALGVKALDDLTLQFRLAAPAPWFLSVLATWNGLPARQDLILAGNGGDEAGSKWTEPATYVGNGPYILTEWEHQSRMHFQANPRYHAGKVPIDDVEEVMISESAVAFAAYLNDELDVVSVIRENKPAVDADPVLAAQLHQYAGASTMYVGFNTTQPPFDNQKVRAAFSFALDRSGYVRNIEGGKGLPARQFVPPGYPGYYDFDLEEQVFNPDTAKRLLAEAGFAGGRGLPVVKFGYGAVPQTKTRVEAIADILARNLGSGVDIQFDPIEPRAYTAAVKKLETTPPMFLLAWSQDYPDPQNWYSAFVSGGTANHSGWTNPDFDQLCDAADVEQDPERRSELYRQAAQMMIHDAPVAFLFHGVTWQLVKPRVLGYREDPLTNFDGEHNLYEFRLAV